MVEFGMKPDSNTNEKFSLFKKSHQLIFLLQETLNEIHSNFSHL